GGGGVGLRARGSAGAKPAATPRATASAWLETATRAPASVNASSGCTRISSSKRRAATDALPAARRAAAHVTPRSELFRAPSATTRLDRETLRRIECRHRLTVESARA